MPTPIIALEFRAANQPAPAKIVGIGPGNQHQLLAFYTANGGVQNSTPALYLDQNNNVGIGTTNPGALLDVNGQIKIQGGTPGVNKLLMSDGAGIAT